MLCRQCGTEIADKAIVCYRCGTATTAPRIKPSPQPARRQSRLVPVVAAFIVIVTVAYIGRTNADEIVRAGAWAVAAIAGLFGVWRLMRR